jgi:hypothetical protein
LLLSTATRIRAAVMQNVCRRYEVLGPDAHETTAVHPQSVSELVVDA